MGYNSIKRIGDLFASSLAIILLSPVFILCFIILSFTGEREVFYFQKRIGFKNRMFGIWKFATMLKNSESIGTGAITLRNDPRVTSFGRILRMTKINELPQLFNVFQGTMSIVGPRPLMKVSFDHYSPEVQSNIYSTKPGITGIGSIIFRDEEKIISDSADINKTYEMIFDHKGKVEMWYIENKSFWTDIKIIIVTALVILFPKADLVSKAFAGLPPRSF